jgi:hypothetical protein
MYIDPSNKLKTSLQYQQQVTNQSEVASVCGFNHSTAIQFYSSDLPALYCCFGKKRKINEVHVLHVSISYFSASVFVNFVVGCRCILVGECT